MTRFPSRRPRATLVSLVAVLVAAQAGCFRNPYAARKSQRQRAHEKLRPDGLPPKAAAIPDDARTLKVRVYADDEFRAQTIRWEDKFERRLETFNAAIAPPFGIKLELADTKPWPRSATGDVELFDALEALEELDPGDDVDWVIGMVSALPQVSATHDQIGAARLLGKHIVMRGYNDTAERALFEKAFGGLSEQAYDERRLHKELMVLVHEWAHTLGALHATNEQWIMAPIYDVKQSQISPGNTAIIKAALPHWGSDASNDVAKLYAAVAEALEKSTWQGWDPAERERMLAFLAEGPEALPVAEVSGRVVPADRKAYYRAADLAGQGQYPQAWRIIEPLTERYETEPEVMVLGCRIAAHARGPKYPTDDLCAAARQLSPSSPEPTAALARVRLAQNKRDEALELLLATQERLESTGDDGIDRMPMWRELADQYYELGAVTPLERALPRLPDEPRKRDLQAFIETTRHRYGLPPNAERYGITVNRERDYTDLVRKVLSDTYAGNYAAAEQTAKEGLKRYRNAPGLLVALCDTYARQRKYAKAREHCRRGLREYDGAAWGHYLSAVLAQQQRDNRRAIGHFEKTIELDPSLESAYRALAAVYDKIGARSSRADLARRYQARFGTPLTP